MTDRSAAPSWGFFSNHFRVLLEIANDGQIRIRDIAERVGLTERTAQHIVSDLVDARVVTRTRHGRRNHYVVHDQCTVADHRRAYVVRRLLDSVGETHRRVAAPAVAEPVR